eukprot:g17229.t1
MPGGFETMNTFVRETICRTKALVIAELPKNAVPGALKAKAHFRRGVARRSLGKGDEAKEDLQAVLRLQPEHAEVLKEMALVKSQLAVKHQQQKAAWGGFLQRPKDMRRQELLEARKERLRRAQERQQMQGVPWQMEKTRAGRIL